jgi:amino acid adenylation domain-containing protein
MDSFALDDLAVTPHPGGGAQNSIPKFDLALSLIDTGIIIGGAVEGDRRLWHAIALDRFTRALEGLLAAATEAPDRLLADLPLAGAQPASVTPAAALPAGDVAGLFEAAAAGAPDAPALWFDGVETSYAALEARANRLAHALIAQGAGRGRHVALFIGRDRGPELIAAVLAVLKAGAAFAVLDPQQASSRHRAMLEDAAPVFVLAADDRPPQGSWRVLDLASLEREAAARPSTRPARSLGPEDAAYVAFTSGSTGRPKGVVATQGGLVRLAGAQRSAFALGAADRVVQFSAITFDAFAWDLAMAWGAGAVLVLGSVDELAPGEPLVRLLEASRATALTIPPSALSALPEAALPDLKLLITAGEPCPAALVDRWARGRRMVNAYGPTETTIWASYDEASPGLSPPIGRAIPGAALHLLDEALAPVPIGAVGQICIGGAGVARGYLGAPDLTAAVFVPDPFSDRPGARLYKSGDLGRWLPDGRLAYLGRRDDQMKIRGFRIEPGEVARTLERLPPIGRVHVGAAARRNGEAALVAWIVPAAGAALDLDALRRAVEDVLPLYMRPACYIPVPGFPVNAHGKVDVRGLPAPDWDAVGRDAATAPEGPVETALARIWGRVLERPAIGRDDHFFALGGDSIFAVRVIGGMRQAGWVLKLSDLFAAPVLCALAARARPARPEMRADLEREVWPLTGSQAGMLFHHLRAPALALYVQRFDLTLTGRLDPAAFAAAWRWLVERHEALRGHVRWRDGEPLLAFAAADTAAATPDLPEADWRMLDPAAQDRAAAEILPPLDPEAPPLMRLALARVGDRSWRFVWAVHHLIADGWSLSVLLDEWRRAYAAFRIGGRPDLPPAVPYRTYLAWLQTRDRTAAQAFWREALGGLDQPTRLAAADEGAGAGWSTDTFELDAAATARLLALSSDRGITLNTLVQGAWARVVQVWTGQSDVVSGMIVSGRPAELAGAARIVGLFVNTVPCRLTVPAAGTVARWLGQVQERLVLMQEHGHLALAELQRMMGLDPDMRPFDALVAVQNYPAETGEDADIEVAARPVPARTDYPLTVLVEPGSRLCIRVIADHRALAAATAAALGRALAVALTALPARFDQPIGTWAIIDAADRSDLLGRSTGAVRPVRPDRMLPCLIAAAARRYRPLPALIAEAGTRTYGELIDEADRVAAWLAGRAIGPERVVALLADRSAALVAAMLGIWRAGAAFLPLGPEQPDRRLAAMLDDVRPDLMITDRRYAERAAALGIATAWLDDPPWAGLPPEAPAVPIHPLGAAYVMFTSGSTGAPKAVVTSHISILNRLEWGQRHRPIGPGDRIVQKTPYTFDVSIWEMVWPLLNGAALVIARPGGHLDADYLARLAADRRATVMHFVPSMLRLFLEDPERGRRLASVRRLICSGEALPGDLRDRVHALTSAELLNYYGPTEASIEVGQHAARRGERDAAVPLGCPIDNARLYIVDRDFGLCPPGFPGELLIGGVPLARGYAGRPELTAERFVPDPFAAEPGARVYRTGDLARWRADGVIEFLGRLDWQVKIRGQRVEPEEVAIALKRLSGIREAVVLYRRDPDGDGRLVAYLTGDPAPPAELRRRLAALLPEAMIPSMFIILDSWPIGPSGKLDRAALPAPAEASAAQRRRARAPGDSLEWLLASEWRAVLRRSDIGADDHFLIDLGGHSLDALRLVGRLSRRWPGAVSLGDFLRAPSIAGVAGLLRERVPPTRAVVPLVPEGDGKPIVLVHPAVGTILCFINLAKLLGAIAPAARGPVWGLEAPGLDARGVPIDSVEALARWHIEDLLPQLEGRRPILAGYSYGGLVTFEMARQLAAGGAMPARLVILDTPAPAAAAGHAPDDLTLLIEIAHLLERYDGRPPSDLRGRLTDLPSHARADAVRGMLTEAGVLGGAVEALDIVALVAVARAAQTARAAYRPQPYDGPVTVLRAASPSAADAASIDPALLADPAFGWRALCRGSLATASAPGDHVSVILPPGADAVAALLGRIAAA